jgi:hypothetical protein
MMKIEQEQKKKTLKQKQQHKSTIQRPSRASGKRKPGQKQAYKVHMLAGQAKDIRIKDLEAELAAMKTKLWVEGQAKDIRIKDLEAELAAMKTKLSKKGQAKDQGIEDLVAELAATKTKLLVERHGKLEALAGLDSCKKERDKSDALASKLVAKKVPGSWNADCLRLCTG